MTSHGRRGEVLALFLGGTLASLPVGVFAQVSAPSVQAGNGANVLAPITVIGTTPLLGLGTPLAQVPANVQTVHANDLDRQHRATLADYWLEPRLLLHSQCAK
jgi:iron complex outermembrane recepter protein